MIISREILSENLIEECMPIIELNHSQTGQFEKLNIDWYLYMSLGGAFVPFVMRNQEEEVVGILFFVTGKYPHNQDWMMAQQVTFYVEPEFRQFSMKLMEFSEDYFRPEIDLIVQAARYDSRFCTTLERKGYEPADVTFIKRLS